MFYTCSECDAHFDSWYFECPRCRHLGTTGTISETNRYWILDSTQGGIPIHDEKSGEIIAYAVSYSDAEDIVTRMNAAENCPECNDRRDS